MSAGGGTSFSGGTLAVTKLAGVTQAEITAPEKKGASPEFSWLCKFVLGALYSQQ